MARIALIFSLLALALQTQLFPGEGRKFTIANKCKYTVWPASDTTSMKFSLQKDETKVIDLPNGWSKLWGRTLCENSTGKFTCRTGNCGSGNTNCSDASILNATTLASFGLNQFDGVDYYSVSFVSGYNLAMIVVPETSFCKPTGCIFDVGGACPKQLRVGGACKSPCKGLGTPEYCCTGRNAGTCKPTNISLVFKKACPRAYTYPLDVATSTMSCKGAPNYTVTFCPSQSTMDRAFSKPIQPWPSLSPSPSPLPPSSSPLPPSSSLSPLPVPSAKANATSRAGGHPPNGNSGIRRKHLQRTSLLVSIPIATSIMLLSGIWVCMHKRKAMKRRNAEIDEIVTVESLQFNLNTIRTATCNFSEENKLGQGGFGEVYKGKLESGQEVAIKRLSKNSGQGVAEFKTEVVLVAKLQHKNLVKLLGFCVASKEKILVYEYLPNSSLDKFLSDPTKKESLDWQTRLKIIVGVARGLLYLHEESRLKVIHRDLKPSNILLDEDMNPKISDFGLAKLFGVNQTEGDTNRIVGTYGYMAPEYAITGHYSVKSDVYSFGVIVLEIVSGQKNKFFGRVQLEEALLHRAWRLWNEKKPLDLVDRALSNNLAEEVMKCIHIGLLCIQEDAIQRPRMRSIVASFSGQSINMPMPKPPHFFGSANNNIEGHHILHEDASPYVYTGSNTITDLYPRD